MNSTIDALELQRLLDGRLTATERTAFLDGLDDDPRLWQTVTLAFVEEQMFRSEFSTPAGADTPPLVEVPQKRRTNGTRLLTSIALMTFALTMGVLLGRSNLMSATGPSGTAKSDDHRSDTQQVGDRKPGNYYVVVTPPGESTPVEQNTEPERDAFDALTTPVLDKRSREIVERYGYRVSEEPVLYMVDDGKGGQYLIPQRRVSVVEDKE